jgi:hypothetical protein
MVKRMTARPQEDQLNRGTRAPVAPEARVDRGHITLGDREVAFDIKFRQPSGQAILSHIAKFQARHVLTLPQAARSKFAACYVTADAVLS